MPKTAATSPASFQLTRSKHAIMVLFIFMLPKNHRLLIYYYFANAANFGVPNKKQKQKKQPKASGLNNWFNRIKKNFLPGNSKKSAKNVAKKGRQANQPRE